MLSNVSRFKVNLTELVSQIITYKYSIYFLKKLESFKLEIKLDTVSYNDHHKCHDNYNSDDSDYDNIAENDNDSIIRIMIQARFFNFVNLDANYAWVKFYPLRDGPSLRR